jgi:hypothetical protein
MVARRASRAALRRVDHATAAVAAPEVSVVITARDRPALLRMAIESVLAQRGVAFECIVVDDGSVDAGVRSVIDEAARLDARVRSVWHAEPHGLSAARNSGIAETSAPFVCFLDDDDHLCVGSLAARLATLRSADADVAGAYCDWITVEADDALQQYVPVRRAATRRNVELVSMPWGPAFIATAPLLRREVLLAAGGFNESLDRAEDAELWARLLRSGYRFAATAHVGVAYRQSPDSMVGAAPKPQLDRLLAVGDWLETEVPAEQQGPGPCPEMWPLSKVKMRAEQLPSIVRYLALIACHDADAALSEGLALLPATLRRAAVLRPHTADLVRNTRRRGGVSADGAAQVVEALISGLSASTGVSQCETPHGALARPIGHHPGDLLGLLPAAPADTTAGHRRLR